MGWRLSFSSPEAVGDDRRRYLDAAKGLRWAGLLAVICVAVVTVFIPESELISVAPNFWRHKYVTAGGILLWFLACLYPSIIRRKFRCIEGTAALLVGFTMISLFMFFLVRWTGGLYNSVFAATFLSLFAVSILLPEDSAIKVILVLVILSEAIVLALENTAFRKHNSAVLVLSLVAYFFAGAVRWLLNRDQS